MALTSSSSSLNKFSFPYPDSSAHDVLLSVEDLRLYLRTIERHHKTLRDEGYLVPEVLVHDMESDHPYITYSYPERLRSLDALISSQESDSKGSGLVDASHFNSLLERGNTLAKRIEDSKGIILMNRNTSNIYYDGVDDVVWLFDLRQSTWDDVMVYYYQVRDKKA